MKLHSSTIKSLELILDEIREGEDWREEDQDAFYLLVAYMDGVIGGTVDSAKLAANLQEI